MASILPVSDLRNYNEVLKNCHKGEPVYLTKNGRGRFVVMDFEDYERDRAEKKLLMKLQEAEEAVKDGEKEKALITKLKTGDTEKAKALLNDLLGYVFFAEGSNLEVVKSRALELSSLLSRAAIEGGATSDSVLKINNQFLMSLQNIKNLDDLCYKLQETIDVFTDCMFNYIPSKGNEITKKAIRYISKNFPQNLTLDMVAGHVHLNPAYFSTLFKQATGSTFKEYLNMVRIEESKRLLANTDYSIIDIALATGFEDQSYFSKVFKKYTGLTPKQYR